MKKIYLIVLAMFFAACSNNPEEADVMQVPDNALNVEAEQATFTRNGFDKAGNFYWSAGDRLGVTTDKAPTAFSCLDLTNGAGSISARFEGLVNGRIASYAVYPFSEHHAMDGTTMTYSLPATYNYTSVDADFFVAPQGSGNSFNAPMWGAIAEGKVKMLHLGGVICIKVQKLPVGENLTLSFVSKQKINGDFTADLSQPTPTIATQPRANEEEGGVTITFSNSEADASGVFYVPAPVGTFEGARAKIFDSADKELYNAALGNITIKRCALHAVVLTMGEIKVNPVNFPDAAFRDYLLKNFDTDKNGGISATEAEAVTQITLKAAGVRDLKGIEHFTRLQRLTVSGNPDLTSLDLSANTHLTYALCSTNGLTSLTLPTDAQKLNYFNCIENKLTSIDIQKAVNLTEFYCSRNEIHSLDISQNPQLHSIGIDGNGELEVAVWYDFDINKLRNKWYDKDITTFIERGLPINEKSFADPNFRSYVGKFDQNQDGELSREEIEAVTTIYLWDKQIGSFKEIGLFKNLKELTCGWCSLQDLDLSKNTQLTKLTCNNNQLSSLDLSQNTQLTYLNCNNNNLSTLDLSQNTLLTEVSCYFNQLTSLNTNSNTKLTSLICYYNKIETLDLSKNTLLTNLLCFNNQLTDLDLRQNTQLDWLHCGSNQLTAIDVSQNTLLKDFSCEFNQITTLDISHNRAIERLFIRMRDNDLQTLYVWSGFDWNKLSEAIKDDNTQIVVR